MDPAQFTAPKAGRVVRVPSGYVAFVPSMRPPTLDYDLELVLLLSRADAGLGELSGLARHLPNPQLLIAPYVRREAVLSSRIEGTRASLSDLLIDEADEHVRHGPEDVLEVRNYVTALEYGVERLKDLPLSLRLVRELHAHLMRDVRGEYATPGEFRRSQNWIGPAGSTPATAPYVPPPPDEMMTVLGEWERFLHERGTIPVLVQCAVMHEQFEAIHPFLDGNGRVGRLLIVLFLIERGRLSAPLLYLSDYIEAHREDYYTLLQRVRTHGDWESWVRFFLTGVAETAQSAVEQAGHVMELRAELRADLQEHPRALELVDHLFMNPYITAARAAELLRISVPTARRVLTELAEAGALREVTGRTWGKLYVADPIHRLVSRDS